MAAYEEIRQTIVMRLAGGEALEGLGAFRDIVAKQVVNMVQPDISIAGGFAVCQKVEALAEAHGVRTLPHMWGSPIRLTATLHWQAVLPEAPGLIPEPCLFEYDMTENGLRPELSMVPFNAADG
jgi:D-galactarolactone cycloisomerase